MSSHLVFLPSGIGNLTLFFQLAVTMASRNCKVTFINIQSKASTPELTQFSCYVSSQRGIDLLDIEIHSQTPSESTISDPFIINIENINNSLGQLKAILSSLSASTIFSDFVIAATMAQLVNDLNIPLYIVSTTSALFLSTVAYLPVLIDEAPYALSHVSGEIEIPGLEPIPKSSLPPTWMHDSPSNYLLESYLLPNARSLSKVKGVLLNTYEWFEPETIAALRNGKVINILPQVFPVGPLQSYEPQKSNNFPWLNEQPAESVVYVNFGRREVLSTDQIRELREGLEICGYKYMWVLKNHDEGGEFQELLTTFTEGTERKSRIINGLVNHESILAHPAIGVFVNQCEWDSVMLAAWHGVPMLAWPQHGDQKMNAETVEKAGLGISVKDWGLGKEKRVEGKEIGRLLKQIMGDLNMKKAAKIVKEKAKEACEIGGSSEKAFVEILEMFAQSTKN